jgi:hypothetical protein
MSASKGRVVWNMSVRSNQKAKPKGNQHQENGKALFTETSLYSRVERRLSGVVVAAMAVVAVAGVDVDVVLVLAVAVVSRRRQRASVQWRL